MGNQSNKQAFAIGAVQRLGRPSDTNPSKQEAGYSSRGRVDETPMLTFQALRDLFLPGEHLRTNAAVCPPGRMRVAFRVRDDAADTDDITRWRVAWHGPMPAHADSGNGELLYQSALFADGRTEQIHLRLDSIGWLWINGYVHHCGRGGGSCGDAGMRTRLRADAPCAPRQYRSLMLHHICVAIWVE